MVNYWIRKYSPLWWWSASLIMSVIVAPWKIKLPKKLSAWKLYKNVHKWWEQSRADIPWEMKCELIADLIPMRILLGTTPVAFEAVCSCGQTFTSSQILPLSSRSWHLHWRWDIGVEKKQPICSLNEHCWEPGILWPLKRKTQHTCIYTMYMYF